MQIWILPKEKNITPRYDQKSFADIEGLKLVVSGSGKDGSLKINQDVEIFLGKFFAKEKFDFVIQDKRKIWLQVISGKIFVNDLNLEKGDAMAITNEERITLQAKENSEFLLFDL